MPIVEGVPWTKTESALPLPPPSNTYSRSFQYDPPSNVTGLIISVAYQQGLPFKKIFAPGLQNTNFFTLSGLDATKPLYVSLTSYFTNVLTTNCDDLGCVTNTYIESGATLAGFVPASCYPFVGISNGAPLFTFVATNGVRYTLKKGDTPLTITNIAGVFSGSNQVMTYADALKPRQFYRLFLQ